MPDLRPMDHLCRVPTTTKAAELVEFNFHVPGLVELRKSGTLGRLEVCPVLWLGRALTQLGAGNALYCIAQRFVELTQSFEPETADSNEAVKKLLTNLTPSAADVIEADYNEYLHRGSWRGFTTGCNCEQE